MWFCPGALSGSGAAVEGARHGRKRKMVWPCEAAVPTPRDTPPTRSPQAVHSFIAAVSAGKTLVEIGTRNGDGMLCFAKNARQATAIEIDVHYCAAQHPIARVRGCRHPHPSCCTRAPFGGARWILELVLQQWLFEMAHQSFYYQQG